MSRFSDALIAAAMEQDGEAALTSARIGRVESDVVASKATIEALTATVTALSARVAKLETPVVTPPPPPPVVQPPTQFKYDRSKTIHTPSYGTLPAYGETRVDKDTGAIVKRVAPGLAVYSRYPLSDPSGRYLFVHGENSTSSYLFDLTTGKKVRDLLGAGKPIGEVNELRWDGTDPAGSFYYVAGMQFRRQTVAGTDVLVRDFKLDFPNGDLLTNDVEGDSSADSRYWCWMVKRIVNTGSYPVDAIVTYDRVLDQILGKATAATFGFTGSIPRPNMVEVSPKGTAAIVHFNKAYGGGQAWKLDFSAKIRNVSVDETHSAFCLGKDGQEWFVSQNNTNDLIEAVSLQTGQVLALANHRDWNWTNFHFGKCHKTPGWALVSTYDASSNGWSLNQIFALPLVANATPLRICPTYNVWPGNEGYRNEASASLSGDGLSVFWTGNWGLGTRARDVYQAQLPQDWWLK